MRNIFFFIRCREHLDADPEETFVLYGEEHEFEYMWELSYILSKLHPSWLVEFGHYGHSKAGTVGEVIFAGEEINAGEDGSYWKYVGEDVYVLTDTPDGLDWVYSHAQC